MHDADDPIGVNLDVGCLETEVDEGLFRERRFGFVIAATQAEIRQFAGGNRIGLLRRHFGSIGEKPRFQFLHLGFRKVEETDPRLSVWICPSDLAMRVDLEAAVGKREAQTDLSAALEWLSRQKIHAGLAQVEHDAFNLVSPGKRNLNRRLHGYTKRAADLTTQKGGRCAQRRARLFGNDWLVQDELRSSLQN